MKLLAALALFHTALLASASAETFTFEWKGSTYSVAVPTENWFEKPAIGEISIYPEYESFTRETCADKSDGIDNFGCWGTNWRGDCLITINDEVTPDIYSVVLLHQLAHCHGWPADHPVKRQR